MWINYQFMAVCQLILIFLHISSQKWLVFANYFSLPNFLPQLANFYTDISVISVTFSNSVIIIKEKWSSFLIITNIVSCPARKPSLRRRYQFVFGFPPHHWQLNFANVHVPVEVPLVVCLKNEPQFVCIWFFSSLLSPRTDDFCCMLHEFGTNSSMCSASTTRRRRRPTTDI